MCATRVVKREQLRLKFSAQFLIFGIHLTKIGFWFESFEYLIAPIAKIGVSVYPCIWKFSSVSQIVHVRIAVSDILFISFNMLDHGGFEHIYPEYWTVFKQKYHIKIKQHL